MPGDGSKNKNTNTSKTTTPKQRDDHQQQGLFPGSLKKKPTLIPSNLSRKMVCSAKGVKTKIENNKDTQTLQT